jgi:hypothetical protein
MDIEKADIEKGESEFEKPIDWATTRWTKQRIQGRALSCTLV